MPKNKEPSKMLKRHVKSLLAMIENGNISVEEFLIRSIGELESELAASNGDLSPLFTEFDNKFVEVLARIRKIGYDEKEIDYYQMKYDALFECFDRQEELAVEIERRESIRKKKAEAGPKNPDYQRPELHSPFPILNIGKVPYLVTH